MSALFDAATDEISSAPVRSRLAILIDSRRALIWGFIVLHLIFLSALMPSIIAGDAISDVALYRSWAFSGFEIDQWPGIQLAWVYPVGALVPIGLAGIAGSQFFQLSWFLMTAALNALSLYFLVRASRRLGRGRYVAAWWWLAVISILAPVSLLRLEGIVAPLVIAGLSILSTRPFVASLLLTAATWIKVWPFAILLALLATGRRWLSVASGALIVSAGIALTVLLFGGIEYIASFATMQTDRGLQLEAPISTPWVWMSALGIGRSFVWLNIIMNTEEVSGPGDSIAASVMDFAMFAAVLAIAAIIVWARLKGADTLRLVFVGSLTLVSSMIVFNKVGSPQYMLWIAPIIAVGITFGWRVWRVPATLMLVIAGMTSLIFPVFYIQLENGNLTVTALLTARNVLVIVLFGWALRELIGLARSSRRDSDHSELDRGTPAEVDA